jgi:2',3'-cyclic-nucleotide 2'-phosphodiesterase (5'-nucleotidase family)
MDFGPISVNSQGMPTSFRLEGFGKKRVENADLSPADLVTLQGSGLKSEDLESPQVPASAKREKKPDPPPGEKTSPPSALTSRTVPLTILHTNDLHGHLEPFVDGNSMVGGMAYLGEVVECERAKDPAHTLVVDGGDSVQGAPLCDFYEGQPMTEAMNSIGYDVETLGNHDFDHGTGALAKRLEMTNAPVLAANLVVNDKHSTLRGKTRPFVIKEIDGLKVGIIGLVTPDSKEMIKDKDDARSIDFLSYDDALKKELPRMREKGADVIILLSHMGADKDREIAARYPDIGVIVGGHTHTEIKKPEKVGNTLIMQAGCFGKNVGEAQLEIDRKTKAISLKEYDLKPIVSEDIYPDPEIGNIIGGYQEKLGPLLSEPLLDLDIDLTQRDCHTYREESTLGDTMTDLLRKSTDSDIGFLTAASMRCNLFKGTLKAADIYTMFPWKDQVTTVRLKGSEIPGMIEQGLSKVLNGVAVSGLKVVIDTTRPEGSQVVSVTQENGEPLDPDKYYTIATRDYLACGTTGLDIMQKAKDKQNVGDIRKVVIDEMKKGAPIARELDGRLVNLAGQP